MERFGAAKMRRFVAARMERPGEGKMRSFVAARMGGHAWISQNNETHGAETVKGAGSPTLL